jgi:hypothetical protein
MGFVNAGRDQICQFIVGAGTATAGQANTYFNNSNAALGVGDSSTAVAAGQTDLQAASNKLRKGMQATYPSVASNVITAQAQFASSEANYAWNEVGFFNSASAGVGTMLSRLVAALGTKASGSTWTLTYTLTVSAS